MSNIFVRIKKKSLSQITEAVCIRLLYLYPIYIISPVFNLIFATVLLIISPWSNIKFRLLISERIGHLSLNTDSFLRQRQVGIHNKDIKYIFFASKSSNEQLLKMYKRHLFVIENNVLYKLISNGLWFWEKTEFYETTEIDFTIYKKTSPTLTFTSEEESKGKRILKEIGIDSDKHWYICIFCRDSSYLDTKFPKGEWSYHNFRNANIDTLILASKYIVSIGGYVIRVGSTVERPLTYYNDKIIDYSINSQSDFMDIYLLSHCKFVLGSPSGICDVASSFGIPQLGHNWAPFGAFGPPTKGSYIIPKKVKNLNTGSYISFPKLLQLSVDYPDSVWNGYWWNEQGYEFTDNTEEEILEATKDMIHIMQGDDVYNENDQLVINKYNELFDDSHLCKTNIPAINISYLIHNHKLFFNSSH
jgi:putative glycosyltransferase (TIGR04372 family)